MAEDPILLIVRRGAERRFAALQDKTSHLDVKVIWDRRVQARRQAARAIQDNQRSSDRRAGHSSSWQLADFAVAVGSAPSPKAKRGLPVSPRSATAVPGAGTPRSSRPPRRRSAS